MPVTVYENQTRLNWIDAGWVTATVYAVNDALPYGGASYRCILAHTSGSTTEPGVGASWTTYWAVVAAKGATGSAGGNGTNGTNGTDGVTEYNYTFSKDAALTIAVGNMRGPILYAGTIVAILVMVGTAPTGASVIVDVNKNGTTIFTTQGNRPTIAASTSSSGVVTNMDVTAVAVGDYLTVDVDQIGSTVAGYSISVLVVVRKT